MNRIVLLLSVKLLGHVTSRQDVCFAPFWIVFFQDVTFMFSKWHTIWYFFKRKLPAQRINTVNVKEHRPCSFLHASAWHTTGDTVLENSICYEVSIVCFFKMIFTSFSLIIYMIFPLTVFFFLDDFFLLLIFCYP